ncbi:MAG: substrate-binding domain-containing protein, partial [Succinivibrio sp.]
MKLGFLLGAAAITSLMLSSDVFAVTVGISLPSEAPRWKIDGKNLTEKFRKAGFKTELSYVKKDDRIDQLSKIDAMIAHNCDVLVIAPVESDGMTEVLSAAKDRGIPVISYDRLIINSDAVTYYASFDNYKVGKLQAAYIVEKLKLDETAEPKNIEFFTGSINDNNVSYFYNGAMEVLKPYFDSGRLICKSGQIKKAQASTRDWSSEEAYRRMKKLIENNGYAVNGERLDAVLSANDTLASGIVKALVERGYTRENFPVITGQDCNVDAVLNMKKDLQSMSVFKDTRILADRVVIMVEELLNGKQVAVNDTSSYSNGDTAVPAYLVEPVLVTKNDIKKVLI